MLISSIQIYWHLLPHSAAAVISAICASAVCMTADAHNSLKGRNILLRTPRDATSLRQVSIADLLELVALLSAGFLITRFYWTSEPLLTPLGTANAFADPHFHTNEFYFVQFIILISVELRTKTTIDRDCARWRNASISVLLMSLCRCLHPAGTVVAPFLTAYALCNSQMANTSTRILAAAYVLGVPIVLLASIAAQSGSPGVILIAGALAGHAFTVMLLSTTINVITSFAILGTVGCRRALYSWLMASILFQALFVSGAVLDYYTSPPSQERDHFLGIARSAHESRRATCLPHPPTFVVLRISCF